MPSTLGRADSWLLQAEGHQFCALEQLKIIISQQLVCLTFIKPTLHAAPCFFVFLA